MSNSSDEPDRNEVERIECEDWDAFTREVRVAKRYPPAGRVFRGHACSDWLLASRWERQFQGSKELDPQFNAFELFPNGRDGFLGSMRWALHEFRHQVEITSGMPPFPRDASEAEQWALARHHGLISPLLDWTYSPYVAAFFGFSDYVEQHNRGFTSGHYFGRSLSSGVSGERVVVWELSLTDALLSHSPDEFRWVLTSGLSTRQRGQQGGFTWLIHGRHFDLESYLTEAGQAHALRMFTIPGTECLMALYHLWLMNIRPATLFPDYDGAARDANTGVGVRSFGAVEAARRRSKSQMPK